MTGVQPMPCPVLLGTVKSGGLPALLHSYTSEKKVAKMEKILKKGVDVDSMNHLGQTPLFCASLLGFANIAEKLLEYGANPNHRCIDLSTPVHAAVFSCNPRLLSSLLDAGGDLRLHDDQGRTPRDWAEAGAQENSPRMLAFLKRCESQMQSMLQTHLPRDVRGSPASSKTLLSSVSPVKLLRPWGSVNISENKIDAKSFACDMVMRCFGYGKLCVEKQVLSLGLAASVPLISDADLGQTEDEPFNSFTCGSFISMTNYSWKGCRVTVKELHDHILQERGHNGIMDLLITEQEYCCQLSHPHLLLLMAVSMSTDLNHSRLVYERVNVGSLFSLLHQRREEFPLLQVIDLLSMVLQVCEVLMYLHGRTLVLRALSSHTILIVHPGVAKVTGLGFMVPSEGSCIYAPPPVPLPLSLVNWAAPEVIKCKACMGKADIYSLCALIQEIYTDALPWGSTDTLCIKKAVELGQALIAHPAVPQPYYQYLETGLQCRAQDRTHTLQDLCYMLRCDIREIRSKNRRNGWYSWSAFQSIPEWTVDVNYMRERDKPETKDRVSHHVSRRIITEEEDSTTDTDDLHWDISHRDVTHLHERPTSHDASLSEPACYNCSDTETDLSVSRSISHHISSIVLNLKVSQVLMQQAESSLDNAEATEVNVPCFDEVDAGKFEGVVGRLNNENERCDGAGKALGPPSRNYIPKWTIDEDVEESQYSSAQEYIFDSESYPRSLQEEKYDLRVEGTKRGQQQTGYQKSDRLYMQLEPQRDSTYQSLGGKYQAKSTWTSEVSEVVALMARGRLGTQKTAVGSSDSEDVEEQQLHLQGWQGHDTRYNFENDQESETRESSDLEQLFKSFACIESASEESTNFHTINCTVNVTGTELEATESDYTQSPIEPNTVYYTPNHHLSDSFTPEEHSQSLSSDEELDFTVEVCQPCTTPAEEKQITEKILGEYQPAHDLKETEPESITPVQSCLPDVAEIADLSSILCSPTQHQEWVGPPGAPPTSQSRGHPPCNSTPRSPRGRRTNLRNIPNFQSLMDTLPWGCAPSKSLCIESYATASSGDSTTTNVSASSIVQSPAVRNVSKENTESPSSANAEFTTASSGARQTTESSQGTSEEMECPTENYDVCNGGEEVGEELLDSEHQLNQQSFDEQECYKKDISEEGCVDETPVQIHEQDPDPVLENVDSNANSQKSTDKSSDDTERANSTLDEDLQRMLLERAAELRMSRGLGPSSPLSQSDMIGAGYTDNMEIAKSVNELGEKLGTADQGVQNHPYRVLQQISLKSQS
ncbi:putative inactive serine/threonine-protein kinase TEX14 [Triplophysa rosa]|uniref:Inactive serine/threonine-protein kinase TEX14 n=1 Tax=Triplophysa rosa TaxID=992332 RepID=A0A9W7TBK5_TRIRA|nr:putative inactive serine/threonine-protein kinase TEX14 [Triplophysa rosa]